MTLSIEDLLKMEKEYSEQYYSLFVSGLKRL